MNNKRVYKELVDEWDEWEWAMVYFFSRNHVYVKIKVEYLLREKIFEVVVIEVRVPIFLWD